MEYILKAIETLNDLEERELNFIASEFAVLSKQLIPQNVIDDFRFTGLNNIDFLCSDYLIQKLVILYIK